MAQPGENIYELHGMTARGGYQIIDFESVPIPSADGESVKIKGIYKYINGIYPCYKPIFVYNFNYINAEKELIKYPPVTNAQLIKDDDSVFNLTFMTISVLINTDDTVHCFIL